MDEERVVVGTVTAADDDLYLEFRTAALPQVAGATSPVLDEWSAAKGVRERLQCVLNDLARMGIPYERVGKFGDAGS